MQIQQSAIETKVMELLKTDDEIDRLVFRTDYIFARQVFKLIYNGKTYTSELAINWIAMFLEEKCGYERR